MAKKTRVKERMSQPESDPEQGMRPLPGSIEEFARAAPRRLSSRLWHECETHPPRCRFDRYGDPATSRAVRDFNRLSGLTPAESGLRFDLPADSCGSLAADVFCRSICPVFHSDPIDAVETLMALTLDDRTPSVSDSVMSRVATRPGEAARDRFQDLKGVIETLFASWLGSLPAIPSRRSHRVPHRQLLGVTPLDEESLRPAGRSQAVTAWDVSAGGISFVHGRTLVCRTIAVTFQFAPGEFQSVLTRLKWCRFTRSGQYRSGGEFVKPIEPPDDARTEFSRLPEG